MNDIHIAMAFGIECEALRVKQDEIKVDLSGTCENC